MSKYSAIKNATNAYIHSNGRQEITGNILNSVLVATIDSLGKFFQFGGLATPDTDPGSDLDQNVAYLAGTEGTYTHLGNVSLENGEIAVIKFDGDWAKETICTFPQKVSDLANDAGYITNAVSDLLNYYTKADSYTRAQVDALIASVKQFQFRVVASLPAASADTMYIIYLVPSELPGDDDVKDEYITIEENGTYYWEQIGRTTVDLSDYPTNEAMEQAIDDALSAYISSIYASVDNNVGIPSVDVNYSGGTLIMSFHNIKGVQGEQGVPGPAGLNAVTASVDNESGIPFVESELVGQTLILKFHNLKGLQGNSGFSGAAEDLELVNNLTQGGVRAGLTAEMGTVLNNLFTLLKGMVGYGVQSLDDLTVSWVQGTIDWDLGTNTSSTVSLRSAFITIGADHILRVSCDTGYFIKGVFAYNTASLSDYSGVLYRGNASGTMDTSKTYIEMPSNGKVLRVVVGRVDGATINVSEGSNITIQDYYEGLGDKTIVEHITSINGEIATLNSIPVGSIDIIPTVADTYVDSTGGLVGMTPTYVSTTLINVEEGDKFTYIGFAGSLALACAGYNTGGTFVQSLLGPGNYDNNQQEITIPSGINKVRFCGRIDTHPLDIKKISGTTKTAREAIIDLDQEASKINYLQGKKLYVIGDSIAYGSVADGIAPDHPFPSLVASSLKMLLTNYGIGGSTIAAETDDGGMYASLADLQAATKETGKYYTVLTGNQTYEVYYWNGSTLSASSRKLRNPISRRFDFMGNDADIVIVEAGTNDFQYNWTDIGTMSDMDVHTLYGALHTLCSGLLSKYMGKVIVFMTPIKRAQTVLDEGADTEAHKGGSYGSVDSQNLFGLTLGGYADIIKEVCRYYSIPVIDMYSNSLLNPSLASQSSLFDSWKTHPYQEGHDMMARYIVGQLKAIVGYSE